MCNPVTTDKPADLLSKGEHVGFEWEVAAGRAGYRCGYVRVPAGHPWHGLDGEATGAVVDVANGLDYAEPDTQCGKGGPDDAWWLGFEYRHLFDAPDPDLPSGRIFTDLSDRTRPPRGAAALAVEEPADDHGRRRRRMPAAVRAGPACGRDAGRLTGSRVRIPPPAACPIRPRPGPGSGAAPGV